MTPSRSLTGAVARGLRKRCPRCAHNGIFASWGTLHDRCPNCSYAFEREDGYWRWGTMEGATRAPGPRGARDRPPAVAGAGVAHTATGGVGGPPRRP